MIIHLIFFTLLRACIFSISPDAGFQSKSKTKTLTTKRSQSELRPKVSRPKEMKRAVTQSHSLSSDEIISKQSQSQKEKMV
jgi:hypothetical protein